MFSCHFRRHGAVLIIAPRKFFAAELYNNVFLHANIRIKNARLLKLFTQQQRHLNHIHVPVSQSENKLLLMDCIYLSTKIVIDVLQYPCGCNGLQSSWIDPNTNTLTNYLINKKKQTQPNSSSLRAYPNDVKEEVSGTTGTSMRISSALERQIPLVSISVFNIHICQIFSGLWARVSAGRGRVLVLARRLRFSPAPYVPFRRNWVFGSLQQTNRSRL